MADILFIAHEASRIGSAVFLRDFLAWLAARGGWSFQIALGSGGPLASDFQALAPTTILLDRPDPSPEARAEATRRLQALRAQPFRLVFANTVCNAPLLPLLVPPGQPLLVHVMEGRHSIETMIGAEAFDLHRRLAHRFVAASTSIRDELVGPLGVPADRVDCVPCAARLPNLTAEAIAARRAQARQAMGIAEGDFVVLGAGTLNWRKGPDLFVQAAYHAKALAPQAPLRFLWAGRAAEPHMAERLAYAVERYGLTETLQFLDERADLADLYAAADLFALTSREEPLGLVMIEAAAFGRPTLCFEGAGAAPAFVGTDAGLAVPYGDAAAMGAAILGYRNDPARRTAEGAKARARALAFHDIKLAGPAMLAAIERTTP